MTRRASQPATTLNHRVRSRMACTASNKTRKDSSRLGCLMSYQTLRLTPHRIRNHESQSVLLIDVHVVSQVRTPRNEVVHICKQCPDNQIPALVDLHAQ